MKTTASPTRRRATGFFRRVLSGFARSVRLLAVAGLAAAAGSASAQNYTWTQRDSQRGWTCVGSSGDGTTLIAGIDSSAAPHLFLSIGSTPATWTEYSAAGNQYWSSVASSSDGQKLIACGTDNLLTNGPGQITLGTLSRDINDNPVYTWAPQAAPGNRTWYSVASSADGQRLLAAGGDSLWVSTDGGANWAQREAVAGRNWHAAGVSPNVNLSPNGNLFVAGDHGTTGGYLYTSTDGVTWQPQTASGQHYWSRLALSDDGAKITAVEYQINGSDPTSLYRSTNSGAAWATLASAGSRPWNGIACDATGDKLVAVDKWGADFNGGKIWTSINGGTAWTPQDSAGIRNWTDVASSSDGSKLVASTSGTYLYTGALSASTVPGAPTIGTATAGTSSASVTFTAPASDGGSPIISYTVTSNPGSITGTGAASPINVTGLTNGTSYTFTVTATNSVGTGPASGASNAVTPTASALPNQPPGFVLPKLPSDLWAWGEGRLGQLGTSKTDDEKLPVPVISDDWQSVAAGSAYSLGVKLDGRLFEWGLPNYAPKQVGSDSDWQSVASSGRFKMALKNDGRLFAWGQNLDGELGLGDTNDRTSPTQVAPGTTWQSVAAGNECTLAVKKDGSLFAWGRNKYGELGLGDTTSRTSPTQVAPGTTWQSVAAGSRHTLAVKKDGSLFAWGSNDNGQLGLGDTTSRTSPTQVAPGTTWKSVSCGGGHTLAVKQDGSLFAWGGNPHGELGLGDIKERTTPTQVAGTTWKSVSGGLSHTLAVKQDGGLFAWGENDPGGALGLGDTTSRTSPTQVGNEANWQSVAAGHRYTLAIKRGSVSWGREWGLRTIPGFASGISTGGEAGQTVTFEVTAAPTTLFSATPAINATNGDLTFTPAAGQSGEAVITVRAKDSGGGQDTSEPQTFRIRILANAVKASAYVGNTNPLDLTDKVLINDTGAPVTLTNPVSMGGNSGLHSLPGQGITLSGLVTYASVTNLDAQGAVSHSPCVQVLPFLINYILSQAKVTTPNPGSANVNMSKTLATPAAARQARGATSTVQPVPGRVIVPGQGEMTACSVRGTPLTNSLEFAATSFAPGGTGPGKLQTLNATWGAGVLYECDLNKADGTAGTAPGWDLWNCTGTFTLTPVSGEKHWISLRSLTTANVPGEMANFNKNAPYAWKLISAAGGITGFSPDLFVLDDSGIKNDFGGGSFGVALQNAGKDLVVTYTPALRTANWTNDATSGLDATRGTLWARHFGSTTAATINGVSIPGINATTVSIPEFDLAGTSLNYLPVDVNNLSGLPGQGSAEMASHFVYNGSPAVLTFKQLTPGYIYTASLFTVGFDTTPNVRLQTFASGTDSRVLDPNVYGDNAGNRIDYTFTADAATRVVTITPVNPGATFALYGVALRLETLLPPVVTTQAVTSLTSTGTTLNGTVVSSDARAPFAARGFVIAATATDSTPELNDPGVTDFPVTGTTGAFSQAITNLLPGTSYSVTAYAENGAGISYSSVVTFTTPTPVLLPAGAVSWYKAENNAQDSVGANHATAATTTYTAGKVGQGFSLTGAANSYLNCTNNASLKLATGSVEAWIKTSPSGAGSSFRGIIVKQNAYGLFLENNNLIGYDWVNSTLPSSVNLGNNAWHHVALTFTAGSMKLYADGVEVASRTSFAVSNQNTALVLGAGDATGLSQNFNGQIDEATIYSRVLSAAEIQSLYNAGAEGKVGATPAAPKDFNVTRNGANYGFGFTSVAGFTYTLWQSDTLTAGSWTNTGLPAIAGDGSVKTMTLPAPDASVPKRYYRLQVQ